MSTRRLGKTGGRTEDRWLKPDEWAWAQKTLPIVCVDVLPIRFSSGTFSKVEAVGLIERVTERGTLGWCLIGGRLLFGEPLAEAIQRQVKETLGHVRVTLHHEPNPLCVAQYSPSGKQPFCLDTRQHAIGLTYAVEISGRPDPRGEATGFEWFKTSRLPPAGQFGFDQHRIVQTCLENLQLAPPHSRMRSEPAPRVLPVELP